MLKVLFATHRAAYFKLALRYWTTPSHVYNLAHGERAHGSKDSKICHELLEMRIVHRHHYSHDPKDYNMDKE